MSFSCVSLFWCGEAVFTAPACNVRAHLPPQSRSSTPFACPLGRGRIHCWSAQSLGPEVSSPGGPGRHDEPGAWVYIDFPLVKALRPFSGLMTFLLHFLLKKKKRKPQRLALLLPFSCPYCICSWVKHTPLSLCLPPLRAYVEHIGDGMCSLSGNYWVPLWTYGINLWVMIQWYVNIFLK